jgi:hypothetical protein
MWNETTAEGLRTIEYLKRASPEVVYQWFQSQPRPEFFKSYRPEQYEGLEDELVKRNEALIDLALAKWSKETETRRRIFCKYLNDNDGKIIKHNFDSFTLSIILNLISNENIGYSYFENKFLDFCDDNFLIDLIDNDEKIIFFDAIHNNVALAIKSLIFLSSNSGIYSSLSDDMWVRAISSLPQNEAILKIEDFKYEIDSIERLDIMRALLNISLIAPRQKVSLDACVRLLENFGNWSIIPELDLLLVQAVDSWSDERLSTAPELVSYDTGSDWDGMRANERLQFHLWRVAGRVGFDANDPRKHVRLAAYAINGVSEYDIKYNLKAEDITSYSKRDGAAFMYANAFNRCIWSVDSVHSEFRNKVLSLKFESRETYPAISSMVHKIREWTSKRDEFPDSSQDYLKLYECTHDVEKDIVTNIMQHTSSWFRYIEARFTIASILFLMLYASLAILMVVF